MNRFVPIALRRCSIALVLLALPPALILAAEPPPGDGPWVVRATFQDRAQVDRLAAEVEPWEVRHDERYVVVAVDRAGWQRLVELGFVPEVDAARTADMLRPRARLPGQVAGIPGFPCYRTVEETFASAEALVAAHPTLASWTDVGDSWEKQQPGGLPGYDMMVLRLTNSATPGPKPKLISTAAIHAREYVTAELMTRFAEYLVAQHGIDPDVTWMLDHNEVHLILQTNPDGRKIAETGVLWRKNTDPFGCGNPSSWGTDLNRNYPFLWGCCGGSSGSPCSETYRGPGPASEPETVAVRDYLMANFPDYGDPWGTGLPIPADASGIFIDIHSYGMLVMWPWGHTSAMAPNGVQLRSLGRKYAWFNNHMPQQAIELYTTDGTTRDFGYGELGVATYTFELGTDFFQSCSYFENTIVPTNMPALLYAARVARAPYMWPAGPDALSVATAPSGSVPSGQPLAVSATIDDTRYNNTNGVEPVQAIAAAEVYVDTPPWTPGAVPTALSAVDGTFDETSEAVTGTLSTAGWPLGRHTLFVRGRDAADNWGPVFAVFIDVVIPVELVGFVVD